MCRHVDTSIFFLSNEQYDIAMSIPIRIIDTSKTCQKNQVPLINGGYFIVPAPTERIC